MYLIDLWNDIVIWYKYAKITKGNRKKLEEKKLRVDWAGRIYTVVNVPEELKNYPNIEMWVMQQLGPYNDILLELGVADYSFPEVQRIEEPGVDAYLVVMYPELNSISFWRIILEIAKWIGIVIAIKITYNICSENNVFATIGNFFSKYV
jgi:hypothetical protein